MKRNKNICTVETKIVMLKSTQMKLNSVSN